MRLLLTLIALCLSLSRPALAGAAWQPAKTHALIVGILEWQDKDLAPFPKENRQDRALERALLANGVPAANIAFLADRQATLPAIRAAVDGLAAKAGPGSTLLFYFAGHGLQSGGRTYLANYDVDSGRMAATGFGVTELADRLASRWRGERALLMADCCHSGALGEVVQRLGAAGKAAACLTSATATNISTGRWTFTESVVRSLLGEGRVDRNGDRSLTFAEVDGHVHDEMKFAEDQLTKGLRAGGFEADWQLRTVPAGKVLAYAAVKSPWSIGMYADCLAEDKWWRAQILQVENGRCQVHYLGWEDKWDEWVPLSRLRAVGTSRFAAGQRVQVEWEAKWYPARIQQSAESFFHFVRYDGYGPEFDEWVTDKRLKAAER
jgi:hypothetical protein